MSVERTSSRDLADEELKERLLDRQEGERWTVGDLLAVEERGYDFLAQEPDLREQIQAVLAAHEQRVREAMAPLLRSLEKTKGLIEGSGAPSTPVWTPISLPTAPELEFEPLYSPAVRQAEVLERTELLQARTIETLDTIASHTRRDAFQWVLFCSAVIAAVAGVVGVITLFL